MNILFSTKVDDRKDAFTTKLKALYDIEKELIDALPKLQEAAHDPELKDGFAMHLAETKDHARRIEEAFRELGTEPDTIKCEGIRGIIKDGEWVVKDVEAPNTIKDALLADAARHAEHYEMAAYMGAIMEAEALGHDTIAQSLKQTLKEEEVADDKLSMAAKKNYGAMD